MIQRLPYSVDKQVVTELNSLSCWVPEKRSFNLNSNFRSHRLTIQNVLIAHVTFPAFEYGHNEQTTSCPLLYHIVSSQKIKRKLTFQLSPYTNRSANHYTYVPVLLVAYIFLKGAEF